MPRQPRGRFEPEWPRPRRKSRRSTAAAEVANAVKISTLRQAVTTIVQRHHVEDFLWLCYEHHTTTRPVRAYQERPAYVQEEHHATVEVRVDAVALETAVRRLGWRVYSTNQPAEQLSLEQAVLAYRSEYLVERSLGQLKGRPAARCDRCMCNETTMPPG